MTEPLDFDLNLEEEEAKPISTFKVVLIASLVALVIGCIPALGSSLIFADRYNEDARSKAIDDCKSLQTTRTEGNQRVAVQYLGEQTDIEVYRRLLRLTPKSNPSYVIIKDGADKKEDKLKNLSFVVPPDACDGGDVPETTTVPVTLKTIKKYAPKVAASEAKAAKK